MGEMNKSKMKDILQNNQHCVVQLEQQNLETCKGVSSDMTTKHCIILDEILDWQKKKMT